ncbi:MAG: sugar phosphate isomerase/epimerase family protein [Planctomycetia bacterium]|nr:sugar phosphate isomerase/epimerase family protein [Planctomycetia bacterium]
MNKNRIGINLLLWTDCPDEKTVPIIEKVSELGFGYVELAIYDQSEETALFLGRKFDDLGLKRTSVSTCSENESLIAQDASVRRNGIDVLKRKLDRAAAMGCSILAGPLHSPLGSFSGTGPTEDEYRRGADAMREVALHAEKNGVKLALEAVNRFECYLINCMEQAADFVRRVDHPSCRLMYDTFHANIEEKSILDALTSVKDILIHFHISENDRSTPGKGLINWEETFDAVDQIGYEGPLVIEAFGSALPNLAAATRIWRRMYQTEDQLAAEGLLFIREQLAKRGLTH